MPPPDRAAVERLYALTDRLQIHLRVLEEARSPVRVSVNVAAVEGDVSALAFLVLMQASRSAKEDLKAIMDGVRKINESKAALRDKLEKPRATDLDFESILHLMATLYERELEEIREDLDSMSEMGEMEALRLQMYMDRLSKLMSTLSNLLKKISDTSSQIAQNLK